MHHGGSHPRQKATAAINDVVGDVGIATSGYGGALCLKTAGPARDAARRAQTHKSMSTHTYRVHVPSVRPASLQQP